MSKQESTLAFIATIRRLGSPAQTTAADVASLNQQLERHHGMHRMVRETGNVDAATDVVLPLVAQRALLLDAFSAGLEAAGIKDRMPGLIRATAAMIEVGVAEDSPATTRQEEFALELERLALQLDHLRTSAPDGDNDARLSDAFASLYREAHRLAPDLVPSEPEPVESCNPRRWKHAPHT